MCYRRRVETRGHERHARGPWLLLALLAASCQGRSERAIVNPAGAPPPPRAASPPPARTFEDAVARLAELRVDGFVSEPRFQGEGILELALREVSDASVAIDLRLTVQRCLACLPVDDLAAWQRRADGLRLLLPGALREAPDTVFEVRAARLEDGDAPYLSTYQLAYASARGGVQQSHAVTAYWNDGAVQTRVIARDDTTAAADRATLAGRRGEPALRVAAERVLSAVLAELR